MIHKNILAVANRTSLVALSSALLAVSPAFAQNEVSGDAVVLPIQAVSPPPAAPVAPMDPLQTAVFEWKSLQQSDNYPFASYARFLVAHPGWPEEARLRKNAERVLQASGEQPSLVVAFFKKFAPQTATAHLRFAEALAATGARDDAKKSARSAWITGSLTPEDESRFLTNFGGSLLPGDNDKRMDALLWARATTNATRQLMLVSPQQRAFFDARLAFLAKAPDAMSRASALPASVQTDAGFVADRTYWLRNTNQVQAARNYLAQPLRLSAAPNDPTKWLQMVETTAKGAADAGQHAVALAIAKKLELTYPANTNIRDKSYAERDSYTNIAWLGGQTALTKLAQPNDAQRMFELYGRAAKSPQTRAKGLYWAGRAAEAAGKREVAQSYYTEAGESYDQFYGQLALEKLGRKPTIPVLAATVPISGLERAAFERSEIVRVTQMLGRQANWPDQGKFIRAIANNAVTEADHVLADELAGKINRRDLSLWVGKSAREDGLPGYFKPSWPMMTVPAEHAGNWTMIHAITRQESQFDQYAQSPVGARGLMQLMPGTARQTAPAAGVSYSLSALTSDPQHNIRLGSTYFGQLMTQYNGSYILAVAAYNAGPGNANKWIRAYGDPRLPGVDKLQWIESIPFSETRNYVQRVLENAVVYDLLNPNRGPARNALALGSFLGTSRASFGSP